MGSALDNLIEDKPSAFDELLKDKPSAFDELLSEDEGPKRTLAPALQKGVDVGLGMLKKGALTGLGVLGWPLERISAGVAMPIAQHRQSQERIKKELGERPTDMPDPGSILNARLRGSGLHAKRYGDEGRIRTEELVK